MVAYERFTGQHLLGPLGSGAGQDGIVMESSALTAVKFFDRDDRFNREADVYSLLRDKHIQTVAGHNVPRLVNVLPSLMVLEMTIVARPFILDFAGAKLPEEVPDFNEEIMAEHYDHLRDLFDDRWTRALHIAEMFRLATGYILLDIHPGNIAFADVIE